MVKIFSRPASPFFPSVTPPSKLRLFVEALDKEVEWLLGRTSYEVEEALRLVQGFSDHLLGRLVIRGRVLESTAFLLMLGSAFYVSEHLPRLPWTKLRVSWGRRPQSTPVHIN